MFEWLDIYYQLRLNLHQLQKKATKTKAFRMEMEH